MRLDEESPDPATGGRRFRQATAKHLVESDVERESAFTRERPDTRSDLVVQRDADPHGAIMLLADRGVTPRHPTGPSLPRPRPTILGVIESSLADPLRALLSAEPGGLVAAWLFGSRARGQEKAASDVDVGVLFDRPPGPRLGNEAHLLEGRLEAALGLPVQLVALNAAPPDLVHRVLRDGVLLLDRSPRDRVRFEVRARNEFFDLQPILARYREARS